MPKTEPSRAARADYYEYVAWDVPTRVFHWVNALAVLGLIATGLEILTGNLLGLSQRGRLPLRASMFCLATLWPQTFFGASYGRSSAIGMRVGGESDARYSP
jgi:hypothetical protein